MSDWSNFAQRCGDNVRRINETKDDGVYAKLYTQDVDRLLRMLGEIEKKWRTNAHGFDQVEIAFEDTR